MIRHQKACSPGAAQVLSCLSAQTPGSKFSKLVKTRNQECNITCLDKVYEMFERGVQVSFFPERNNLLKKQEYQLR